jgi:pimeloyl-ACP methyl ester carboxylesterase
MRNAASLILLALAWAVAAPPQPPASPPPVTRVELGPDHNVCGITVPLRKPAHKIGLIVWFHGGMRSQNREKGLEAHRALLSFVDPAAYYFCSPSAFAGADWLSPEAMAHTEILIDYMLAHYPVDPHNLNLVGVSDGNLAVIRYSMDGKRPVRRRLLISSAPQIVLPPENLAAQKRFAAGSWDFFQGGRDRLFPVDQVLPYLQQWEKTFPNVRVHYYPDGEHDFSYYSSNALDSLKSIFSNSLRKSKGKS